MLQAEALLAGLEARDDSTSIVMLHAGWPRYRRIGSLAYGGVEHIYVEAIVPPCAKHADEVGQLVG